MRVSVCVCERKCIAGGYNTHLELARTIYIRYIYGIFGRKTTKYTVIYGVLANPTYNIPIGLARAVYTHRIWPYVR